MPGAADAADPTAPRASVPARRRSRRVLFCAVCALGISAIVTQLVLMRELLCVFAGNEMIFGIILGNWLLLTAIGALAGRSAGRLKHPERVLIAAQILVAVLPTACVLAVRVLRNVVFIRGQAVGVSETVAACFVLLAPYCLIAGYLLTLTCRLLARRQDAASIGQVYFLDNIGDILGGLAFTFVLVHLFGHFGITYFPALLNLALAAVVAGLYGRAVLLGAALAVAGGVGAVAATTDLDALTTRIQYPGHRIVYQGNSPYGRLVVTEYRGQVNFIENGVDLFSTQNVQQVEETVHYAMAQRPEARRVLLIAGGVSGTAAEVLRYGVAGVDYVELDPLIIAVARRYLPGCLADERIHVHTTDGRLFVRRTPNRYDVVIVDVPDPSTSQLNRFYTRAFFREVKGILAADGVLSFSLGLYENYIGREQGRLLASAHRTLSEVFGNVRVLPGESIFFLASDGALTADVVSRIEAKGIATRFVNRHYVPALLTEERTANVRRVLSPDAPVNRDFSPILYYYHLLYWASQFELSFGILQGALVLVLLAWLARLRPVGFAIFTTGFAAAALEVVLLVAFQILYGSVYHQVGLIVTMFMVGLSIGSFTMTRLLAKRTRRDLVILQFAVAAYAVLLPPALLGLAHLGDGAAAAMLSRGAIPLLTLLLALLVGLEFPLAGKVDFDSVTVTASRLYTADLVGASLGALLVSTLLIPVIGVVWVCLLTAGLNAASGVLVWARSRN